MVQKRMNSDTIYIFMPARETQVFNTETDVCRSLKKEKRKEKKKEPMFVAQPTY